MSNMTVLDTNVLLRYVLQDVPDMAERAEMVIRENDCLIPIEVVAEIVYVLGRVYKVGRGDISQTIIGLLEEKNLSTSHDALVAKAMEVFRDSKLDFVDCLMVGYSVVMGHEVFTFDQELMKQLRIK